MFMHHHAEHWGAVRDTYREGRGLRRDSVRTCAHSSILALSWPYRRLFDTTLLFQVVVCSSTEAAALPPAHLCIMGAAHVNDNAKHASNASTGRLDKRSSSVEKVPPRPAGIDG